MLLQEKNIHWMNNRRAEFVAEQNEGNQTREIQRDDSKKEGAKMRDEMEVVTGRKILINPAWSQEATVTGSGDWGVIWVEYKEWPN